MSQYVDTALVQSYRRNIEIKFQQKISRLRDWVRVEPQNSEFDFHDRIGATDVAEITTRHGDTPLIETPHDRRRVALRDFDWADLIDRKDKVRMLADPASSYVQNAVMAFGRKIDDLLIEAAFATAYTDKTGATPVTFPASASYVVPVNYHDDGGTGNTNLSVDKLRRVRYLFDKDEAANDDEADLVMVVDPSQIQGLLQQTSVTSADYAQVKALVQGEVDTFMGFKFIKSNRLAVTADPYRKVIAFERQGLLLAVGDDITVRVSERDDKRYSVQPYVAMSMGSTRMWEEKVRQVLCDETAPGDT
jgi:hypothetical protein